MTTTWMLTGGAGYIGSHIVRELLASGFGVVVVDDLSTGLESRIPAGAPLVIEDVGDRSRLAEIMRDHQVEGVIHLAAKKAVGESVARPLFYFDRNVSAMVGLLEAMSDAEVNKLIYSSSAAVYGEPADGFVTERSPTHPVSPYGQTKVVGEWLVSDEARARALDGRALSRVSLRYFNVAGAGEPTLGDTSVANLIPLAFRAISQGRPPEIFGTDYPTADGTCVRDYIHVVDLARAHVDAVRACSRAEPGAVKLTLNVGTGAGSSVREVLRTVADVTGIDLPPLEVDRRAGDPAVLVARAERIVEALGWHPRLDLRDMVASAWEAWPRT